MYGNAFLGGIIRYGIKKIPTNRTNSNWFYCTIGYRCCYNGQCVGLESWPHFGGCRSWLLGGGCVCFNFNLYFFLLWFVLVLVCQVSSWGECHMGLWRWGFALSALLSAALTNSNSLNSTMSHHWATWRCARGLISGVDKDVIGESAVGKLNLQGLLVVL